MCEEVMGTVSRTTYRIECRTNDNAGVNSMVRGLHVYGMNKKPKDLGKWCEDIEKSERKGGVNHHAALGRGFLLSIHSAKLIRQSDGEILSNYKAAPFRAF